MPCVVRVHVISGRAGISAANSARRSSLTRSTGAPLIENPELTGGRCCCYRWHGDNPVTFERYMKHTMEHGHANDHGDNFYSAGYWYQSTPYTDFPALPPVAQRIPMVKAG